MKNYIQPISPRDQYNCHPLAIMNAAVWSGKELTYEKDFGRVVNDLLSEPYNQDETKIGYRDKSSKVLRSWIKPSSLVKSIFGPTVEDLHKWLSLNENHSFLLEYSPEHEFEAGSFRYHCIFVESFKAGRFYYAGNPNVNLSSVDIETMAMWLSFERKIENKSLLAWAHFLSRLDEPLWDFANLSLVSHVFQLQLLNQNPIEHNDVMYMGDGQLCMTGSSLIGKSFSDCSLHSYWDDQIFSPIFRPILGT